MAERESEPRDRSTIAVDGFFDIETEAWDRFVAGCLYRPGFPTVVATWEDEETLVDAILSHEGTLWAHNGGRYDFLWLVDHLLRRGAKWRVSLSGSSIASLTVGKLTLRDSARLVPMSLDKGSQIGSVRKGSPDLPCSCPRACGGYCAIKRGMPRKLLQRVIDYMVLDCTAGYSMLDALSTFAARHDLDLRGTLGASAWATAMRMGAYPAEWGGPRSTHVTRDYTDARRGYYGGRTQVFRPVSGSGFHYDLNSAYPAALANLALPTGERKRVTDDEATRAFSSGKGGVFCADVRVPECFLPPLPVRTKHRSGYPTGYFRGWWTGLELQGAMQRGAAIGRIVQGLVWSDSEMVLAPFCRHVWGLRNQAGPKTALGTFLKLYSNAITGKLGARPLVERITADPSVPTVCPADFNCGRVLCGRQCCPHRCTGKCGSARPIDPRFPIFSRSYEALSECSQVHWSAYLTAYTRVELLRFAGDGDDAVYSDTDSLFCERERFGPEIGPELGQWKLEDQYQHFRALAPKAYEYADQDGVAHGAFKGIPDAVRNFSRIAQGESVTSDRGVNTFRSAMRFERFFARKSLTRGIKADGITFGDRRLGSDGRTYPPTADALSEQMWRES